MKSKKAKLRIFILLLLAAVGTYALVTFTGLLVEEETHVLVDDDLNAPVEKVEVNTKKVYSLRTKIEKQIKEDRKLIENSIQEASEVSKEDLNADIEDFVNELDNAKKTLLDMNEEELKKLHERLQKRHEELQELLKNNN